MEEDVKQRLRRQRLERKQRSIRRKQHLCIVKRKSHLCLNPREESVCGVYFLCTDSEIVYVGQSAVNVKSRIVEHWNNGFKDRFTHAYAIRCDKKDLDYVESACIRFFEPSGQGRYKNGKGAFRVSTVDAVNDKEIIARLFFGG